MKKGKIDIFYGPCWGDEGKGKIVDSALFKRSEEGNQYKAAVRFQGGPNAGHTLYREGKKCVLHQIPSGVFYPDVELVCAAGMVIDPILFVGEMDEIKNSFSIDVAPRLFVADRAKLISPLAPYLDAAEEWRKKAKSGGTAFIGTTSKGIGPAYASDRMRIGLRVGDALSADFQAKCAALDEYENTLLQFYIKEFGFVPDEAKIEERKKAWTSAITRLATYTIGDAGNRVRSYLLAGSDVLGEGAQGSMLDIDHGDYPYVTSSSTLPEAVTLGIGLGAEYIGEKVAVLKWYNTKVGGGVFPSRMDEATEKKFQEAGNEFGATTGRPRMCGWVDFAVLRYIFSLTSPTKIVITKADICPVDEIAIATEYPEMQGSAFPFSLSAIKDVTLKKMQGWAGWNPKENPALPEALTAYLNEFEAFLKTCPSQPMLYAVSIGPEHEDMYYWGK